MACQNCGHTWCASIATLAPWTWLWHAVLGLYASSGKLMLPALLMQKKTAVDELIARLRLESCRNVRIGRQASAASLELPLLQPPWSHGSTMLTSCAVCNMPYLSVCLAFPG